MPSTTTLRKKKNMGGLADAAASMKRPAALLSLDQSLTLPMVRGDGTAVSPKSRGVRGGSLSIASPPHNAHHGNNQLSSPKAGHRQRRASHAHHAPRPLAVFRVAAHAVIACLRCMRIARHPGALSTKDRDAITELYRRLSPITTIKDLRNFLQDAGCVNATDDVVAQHYIPRTYRFDGSGRPLSIIEAFRVMREFKTRVVTANRGGGAEGTDAAIAREAHDIYMAVVEADLARGGSGAVTTQALHDIMSEFNVNVQVGDFGGGSYVANSFARGFPTTGGSAAAARYVTEGDIVSLLAARQSGHAAGRVRRRRQSNAGSALQHRGGATELSASTNGIDDIAKTSITTPDAPPAMQRRAHVAADDPFEMAHSGAFTTEESIFDDRTALEMQVDELRGELAQIQLPPPTQVKFTNSNRLHSRGEPANQTIKRKTFPKLHHRLTDYTLDEVCRIIDTVDAKSKDIAYASRKVPKSTVSFAGEVRLPRVSAVENVSFLGLRTAAAIDDDDRSLDGDGSRQREARNAAAAAAAERQANLVERLKQRRDVPVSRIPPPWKQAWKHPRKVAELPNLYGHVRGSGLERLSQTPTFTLSHDEKSIIIQSAVIEQQRASTAMAYEARFRSTAPRTANDASCRSIAAAACLAIERRTCATAMGAERGWSPAPAVRTSPNARRPVGASTSPTRSAAESRPMAPAVAAPQPWLVSSPPAPHAPAVADGNRRSPAKQQDLQMAAAGAGRQPQVYDSPQVRPMRADDSVYTSQRFFGGTGFEEIGDVPPAGQLIDATATRGLPPRATGTAVIPAPHQRDMDGAVQTAGSRPHSRGRRPSSTASGDDMRRGVAPEVL